MVKAVVDVHQEIIALDSELHADLESLLIEHGSEQENLWGINIYPELGTTDEEFIEFDAMINLRPSQSNNSRYVEDAKIRDEILQITKVWITS